MAYSKSKSQNHNDFFKSFLILGALLLVGALVVYGVGRGKKESTFRIPVQASAPVKSSMVRDVGNRPESRTFHTSRRSGETEGLSQDIAQSASPETKRAMELVDMGNWHEAEQILKAEIEANPNNLAALIELSMIQIIDKHEAGSAQPYLESAVKIAPENESVLLELLGVYEANQNWDQATQFLNSITPTSPDSAKILDFAKGASLLAGGKPQEAVEALQRSVYDGGYKEYAARETLAKAFESSGRTDDAINEYNQIIDGSYKPAQVRLAKINMANVYLSKGDIKGARGILEPMLEQDPKDRWVAKLINQIDNQQSF